MKFSHEEYLKKLKDKNIELEPLEEYQGSTVKIKHLCSCGNTFNIAPGKVYRGDKCGCLRNKSKKKTNTEYLNELKELEINIMPLEPYKGTNIKIKHKCTCGNVWEVEPRAVLNGNKCGCKNKLNTIEKYKNRKTILYYIKINNYWKIGISIWERYKTPEENILKYRYAKNKDLNIKVLKYKVYDDGSEAYLNEQSLLNLFSEFKYDGSDMENFGGKTELFKEDILSNYKI